MNTMKIYISGKITGLPINDVLSTFRAAEAKIRKFNFTPVSPLDNGLPFEAEWADQMGRDIAILLRCEAIYMLPDWQQSEGATIEYLIARQRRMRIFLAETFEAAVVINPQTESDSHEEAE